MSAEQQAPVKIVKQGSLPSMIRWYVALPEGGWSRPFRTRTDARAWCDEQGIPWKRS